MPLTAETQTTYTMDQVLELLRVSRSTLHRWRRKGYFPQGFYANLRGDLLWTRVEVDRWLADRNLGSLKALANPRDRRKQRRTSEPGTSSPEHSHSSRARLTSGVRNGVNQD
jgi:predicted DNA-binding transcriptional regulator AlpA